MRPPYVTFTTFGRFLAPRCGRSVISTCPSRRASCMAFCTVVFPTPARSAISSIRCSGGVGYRAARSIRRASVSGVGAWSFLRPKALLHPRLTSVGDQVGEIARLGRRDRGGERRQNRNRHQLARLALAVLLRADGEHAVALVLRPSLDE